MDFGQNSGPDHQLAASTDGSKGDDFVHFETEEAAMNVKVLNLKSTIKYQIAE